MNSMKQMAVFTGTKYPVSFRNMASYVIPSGEAIHMSEVIRRLLSLPEFTLNVEAHGTAGEAPLTVSVHINGSDGVIKETRYGLYKGGTLMSQTSTSYPGAADDQRYYGISDPGVYQWRIDRTGITRAGVSTLTRTFDITARPRAAPPPPTPSRPTIVAQSNGDGSFTISGSDFNRNATVHIRVVDDALATLWFSHTADGNGKFVFPTGRICQRRGAIHFSANDGRSNPQDLTGTLWSNTVTSSCPG